MKRIFTTAILVAFTLISPAVSADFQTVPIGVPTADIHTYTDGIYYPSTPTTIDVGGVPFDLVPFTDGQPDSLGVLQIDFNNYSYGISADVPGARFVHTLINSAFGVPGTFNGYVQFFGANGSSVAFSLTQGVNIRDHYDGGFNNLATDVFPNTYGPQNQIRLDRQSFELPPEFANDTLNYILFGGLDIGFPQGNPFLAAVTVETVPEPSTLALLTLGGVIAFAARRSKA